MSGAKRLNVFERYLALWVVLCMTAGVALGKLLPGLTEGLRRMEAGEGSHINLPIAVLIWLMIYPMMLKVDLGSLAGVGRRPRGLLVTLFVNWAVKPFSMALIGWVFFRYVFRPWIGPELADQYIAGTIILAAAPCTAMVFVWSYLTDGDPAYTLVQVSVNDIIMLVLFAPIVGLLVAGASSLTVPFDVLLYSVAIFIVIPLALGSVSRTLLIRTRGREWFETRFVPFFHPITVLALLATLLAVVTFLPVIVAWVLTRQGMRLFTVRYMLHGMPFLCVLVAGGVAGLVPFAERLGRWLGRGRGAPRKSDDFR